SVDLCRACQCLDFILFFFFHYTATPEIYTLSLHDALPISLVLSVTRGPDDIPTPDPQFRLAAGDVLAVVGQPHQLKAVQLLVEGDRKSTRLNSSHGSISYAVFCLKKKKPENTQHNIHIHNN